MENGPLNASVNLGTGKGSSIFEIIRAGEEVTGMTIPHRIAPRRPGDPPVLVADPSEALTMLKWKAEFTNIRRILSMPGISTGKTIRKAESACHSNHCRLRSRSLNGFCRNRTVIPNGLHQILSNTGEI